MRNATKILLVLAAALSVGACVNSEQASSQPPGQPQYTAPPATESAESAPTEPPPSEATGPECTADDIAVAGEPGADPQITLPTTCSAPKTLLTKDLVPGTGAEAVAGSTLQAQYHLVTWSDGKLVESSYQTGQQATLENLGSTPNMIPAWNEGLIGVHQGGRRLLVVPPDKGYGEEGNDPVRPNETLVFVVDATAVTPPA